MRNLTPYAQDNAFVKELLEKLIDSNTGTEDYADTFYQLGKALSSLILETHPISQVNVMLACSSEDADWLSKGILDHLTQYHFNVRLAVFWNLRTNAFDNPDLAIAPITKSYIEHVEQTDCLIICKSIISSSCVVRTNLTQLIEHIQPKNIYIAAPVLLDKAIENLKSEFPLSVSKKFEFFYFAKDNELNEAGDVVPGIGGSVYKRLGLGNQATKNKYIPSIVKERRVLHSKLS